MTVETLKAISYITSVAAEELTILQWITILNIAYKKGIPEHAKMSDAINFFVEKFPNFEERAKDNSQESYDKLYEDFMIYVLSNN